MLEGRIAPRLSRLAARRCLHWQVKLLVGSGACIIHVFQRLRHRWRHRCLPYRRTPLHRPHTNRHRRREPKIAWPSEVTDNVGRRGQRVGIVFSCNGAVAAGTHGQLARGPGAGVPGTVVAVSA